MMEGLTKRLLLNARVHVLVDHGCSEAFILDFEVILKILYYS
jgi:hypothetical protein